LDSVDEGHFYVLRSSGQLTKSKDIAYAVDLLSGMSSLTGLQLKVDIISAFSIISKLRTFLHLPSGNPSDFGHLIIHTTGWVGQQIIVATKGVLKVLGNNMIYPLKKLHSQYKESLLRATKSCIILMRARVDPGNKRTIFRCCVSKRSEYNGQLSSWTTQ